MEAWGQEQPGDFGFVHETAEGSGGESAFGRNGEASLSDRAHGDQAWLRQFCRRKSKGVGTLFPPLIGSIHSSRHCIRCSVYS